MRKLFTFILSFVAATFSVSAQDSPTFTLLDAEGNELESGSVITVTEWAMVQDEETGELVPAGYMDSGLQLRKNVDDGVGLGAQVDLTVIDNGTFYEGIVGMARESTEAVSYETGKGDYYGTDPRPVNLHWTPASADAYGVCEATVQFNVYERTGIFPPFRYEKVEDGPVVTIKFVNEAPQPASTFTLLDAEGNELESGSVVTVTEWAMVQDAETGELVPAGYMDSGLQLRKNVDDGVGLGAQVDLTVIDNGTFYEGIVGMARESTEAVSYETGKGDYYGTDPRPVNLHWTPASADAYGVCEATVQFNVYERTGIFPPFRYEKVEDGPVVTIRFVNEAPQSASTFTLLDAEGNELESGSVVTVTEWAMEEDAETGELVPAGYMDSGLQLRKNVDDGVGLGAQVDLTVIDNGTFYEGIVGMARESTETVSYETGKGDYYGTDPRPVNLHWTPASADAYGVCEATVQFNVYERTGIFPPFRYEKVEDGPVVTVKFVNEYSGISAAQQTDLMPTSRYLLSGQQITVPRKGLNIVKYADGSTRKVMVK